MTPQVLQEELKKVIRKSTKDIALKNPDGEKTALNIFFQDLPKKESDEDADPYPYCIIKLVNGSANAVDEEQNSTRVLLLFGVYDSDVKNEGHQTVLAIINRLIECFSKNNEMTTFIQKGSIEWVLDDEDAFPYFFGGMDLTFIPTMFTRREIDKYL